MIWNLKRAALEWRTLAIAATAYADASARYKKAPHLDCDSERLTVDLTRTHLTEVAATFRALDVDDG